MGTFNPFGTSQPKVDTLLELCQLRWPKVSWSCDRAEDGTWYGSFLAHGRGKARLHLTIEQAADGYWSVWQEMHGRPSRRLVTGASLDASLDDLRSAVLDEISGAETSVFKSMLVRRPAYAA